ncbi:hypothetical protein BJV78DRAFT_1284994 [Lactifluus subvellereus]|nr:hypothetical protein BJV78DRAFT_1284994 [Lactifluus subvellereus]
MPDVRSLSGRNFVLGAARLYRSLCQHGSLTEYMTSGLPHFSPGRPILNAQYRAGNVHSSIHVVVVTESNSAGSTSEAPVIIPEDPVQLRSDPGASNPRPVHEKSEDKARYDLETASFTRMVIGPLSHLFLAQTPETP